MLSCITLENFKPFAEAQSLQLRPITLLFGHNSSGKSSIMQLLLLLKQTLLANDPSSVLCPSGQLVDLGCFADFIHAHETTRPLRVRLSLDANVLGQHGCVWAGARRAEGQPSLPWYEMSFSWAADSKEVVLDAPLVGIGGDDPLFRFRKMSGVSDRADMVLEALNTEHPFFGVAHGHLSGAGGSLLRDAEAYLGCSSPVNIPLEEFVGLYDRYLREAVLEIEDGFLPQDMRPSRPWQKSQLSP